MQVSAVEANQGAMMASTGAKAPRQEVSVACKAEEGVALRKDQIASIVEDMQHYISRMNVSLKFSTYGEDGEKIAVTVADKETGEVIREIPPKELQNLYAKMSEVAGIIFNKEA